MNAVAKREPKQESPLEVLERIRYRAPFKSFDPRSYDTFCIKHLFPKRYLDSIGIELICELILNQFSPKDISIALYISQGYLLKWVGADPAKQTEWDWALQQEADNLMFEARDKLEAAFVPADKLLDKAEKIANHKRFMAKGFGPKRWGQKVDVTGMPTGATVTYNFNVGLTPEQIRTIQQKPPIEHEKEVNPPVAFSFNQFVGSGLNTIDLTVPKEDMGYEEAKAQESA